MFSFDKTVNQFLLNYSGRKQLTNPTNELLLSLNIKANFESDILSFCCVEDCWDNRINFDIFTWFYENTADETVWRL